MEKELGSIEPGKMADLAIIDLRHPAMVPTFKNNLISNLVYSCQSDCVRDTIVNGRIVMKIRKILSLDQNDVIMRSQNIAEKFF